MKYSIIDTHCHPQLEQYDSDRDQVIRETLQSGIGMVCIGTNLTTSKAALELADCYDGLYTSVGSHPTDAMGELFDIQQYRELAQHPSVVAIGEIGLDYFHAKTENEHNEQMERLKLQLDLAAELSKPVVIHCRDAHVDMLSILQQYTGRLRGVIHSFNGRSEEGKAYCDLGFYIGLNAIVTYAESYASMVRSLPIEHIVLETDAPYLSPAPHRGKRNHPTYIVFTAEAIAKMRGDELASFKARILANTKLLYSIE